MRPALSVPALFLFSGAQVKQAATSAIQKECSRFAVHSCSHSDSPSASPLIGLSEQPGAIRCHAGHHAGKATAAFLNAMRGIMLAKPLQHF